MPEVLYKSLLYQGLGIFLFFAKHEAYNWRYDIMYQYGLKRLSIVRPNKITFCNSVILMLFILSMAGNLQPLPKIIN